MSSWHELFRLKRERQISKNLPDNTVYPFDSQSVVESRMSIAPNPSYVTLPDLKPPYPALLDFLDHRFPKVGRDVWRERLVAGKVADD